MFAPLARRVAPLLLALLSTLAPPAASASETAFDTTLPTAADAEPILLDRSRPFWDRYLAANVIAEADPPTLRETMARLAAGDSLDMIGHWMRAYVAATRADTVALAEIAAEARGPRAHAGSHVALGLWMTYRNRADSSRAEFLRASRAYAALGRWRDAAHARLFAVVRQRQRGDLAREEADLADAMALARRTGDPLDTLDVAVQGAVRLDDARPEEAVRRLRAAIVGGLPPGQILLEAHRRLGSAYRITGHIDSSVAHYERAYAVARAPGQWLSTAPVLQGLANAVKSRGEMRLSLALSREGIAGARAMGHRKLTASMLTDLGNTLLSMGRLEDAGDTLRAALRIYDERSGEEDRRASVFDQLAGVHALLGRSDAARALFDSALALCRTKRLPAQEAFVLLHLASFEADQGNHEAAIRWNDDGLRVARATGRRRAETLLLSQRAGLLADDGRLDSALVLVRDAARLVRDSEPRNRTFVAGDEAAVLVRMGRYDDALAVVDGALADLGPEPEPRRHAWLVKVRGKVLAGAGRADSAAVWLERALAISHEVGAADEIGDVELWLASARLAQGRTDTAAAGFERALEWYEGSLIGTGSSDERAEAMTRWQDAYAELATAYARLGRHDDALRALHRGGARELQSLIERAEQRESPGRSPLHAERRSTREALAEVQAQLVRRWSEPGGARASGTRALSARVDSLRRRHDELTRQIDRLDGARQSSPATAPTAAELAAALGPGRRLVAFVGGTRWLLRLDVDASGVRAREIPWPASDVAARVEACRTAMERPGSDWQAPAAALADTLLAGALDGDPRALVIVPYGPLHALPFEALRVAGPGRARRALVERVEVTYTSSPALLLAARDSAEVAGGFAAFASPGAGEGGGARAVTEPELRPLPHARREVEGLRTLWPSARVYVGGDATEPRFYSELERASMLHVASHGLLDARRASFSALVLAPGEDDGLVQAFEVARRRGRLELVTLSACESGRGRVLAGEGVLGLSRAFTLAGARRLVASLWKVDDAATADFMLAFYARLRAGEAPAAALRATKLEFLRGGGAASSARTRGVGRRADTVVRSHPSAWAAFVMMVATNR